MNTMLQTFCSWSTHLTIWTIVLSVLFLAIAGWFLWKHSGKSRHEKIKYFVIVALALIVLFISPIFYSPRKIQITNDSIKVKMMVGSYSIPVKDIEKIEPYKSSPGFRICGIGTFFCNVGWFKNETLGKHLKFVTDSSKSYTIYRKSDIPVVVTADDGAIFSQLTTQN